LNYVLAVDLGATYVRVAIASCDGKIVSKAKERVVREGRENAIAKQIIKIYENLIEKVGKVTIDKIAIGSIGPLDMRKGIIINPPNLPFEKIVLKDPLKEYFKADVLVLNDAVSAAWGEKHFGLGRDVENLAYITLSTGIGVGVIVNGKLLLGKDGNAHEMGHAVVNYDSPFKCGCGRIGHWEAYASGRNIPRFAKYLAQTMFKELLNKSILKSKIVNNTLEARDVFEAAKKKDPLALKIIDELGKVNASGFANVINAYDPELITVGGAIALNNPKELVIDPILKYLDMYVVNRVPKIEITKLGDDIVLYGAVAAAINPPL